MSDFFTAQPSPAQPSKNIVILLKQIDTNLAHILLKKSHQIRLPEKPELGTHPVFRFRTTLNRLIYLATATFVASTTHASEYEHFEGLGDYRFFAKSGGLSAKPDPAVPQQFTEKYVRTTSGSTFTVGDTISVFLKNAQFAYLPETNWYGAPKSRGQVAIVANVSQTLDQLSAPGSAGTPGRVVFYSPDVRQGQSLNQSFTPVYGPKAFQDGMLHLDMTVLELDHDAKGQVTSSLLQTLANLGVSKLGAVSPILQDSLNTIGAALLSGAKARDDVMAKYRLTLLQEAPASGQVDVPLLQEGDLVIVRQTNRQTPVKWENYEYCPNTGRLSKTKSAPDATELGYVVFSFVKNAAGESQSEHLLTLPALVEAVQKDPSPEQINKTKTLLDKINSEKTEAVTFRAAKADLEALINNTVQYREVPAARLARVLQISLLRHTHVERFATLKGDPGCADPVLRLEQSVSIRDLETLTTLLKTRASITPDQLASTALLGDIAALACPQLVTHLNRQRDTLVNLLASPRTTP